MICLQYDFISMILFCRVVVGHRYFLLKNDLNNDVTRKKLCNNLQTRTPAGRVASFNLISNNLHLTT